MVSYPFFIENYFIFHPPFDFSIKLTIDTNGVAENVNTKNKFVNELVVSPPEANIQEFLDALSSLAVLRRYRLAPRGGRRLGLGDRHMSYAPRSLAAPSHPF